MTAMDNRSQERIIMDDQIRRQIESEGSLLKSATPEDRLSLVRAARVAKSRKSIRDVDFYRRHAARGDLRFRPRFHAGIGITQLSIQKDKRLHIWHPDLPPSRLGSPWHNHRFSFKSTVLLGELHHRVVLPRTGHTYDMWETFCEAKTPHGSIVNMGTCDLDFCDWDVKLPGDEYSFEAGLFHESSAVGITATLMTKTWESQQRVFVVSEKHAKMTHAFLGDSPRPSDDRLWEIIDAALKSMDHDA